MNLYLNPLKIPLTIRKLTTPDGLEIIYLSGAAFLCYRKEPDDPEYQQWPPDTFKIESFSANTTVEAVRI